MDIDKEFTVTVRFNKHALWYEFIGCAMSTYIISMSIVNSTSSVQFSCPTIAYAICIGLFYLFGRKASGAHYNPAVTVAMALNKSFPWIMVPGYIITQLAGSLAGTALQWYTVPESIQKALPMVCCANTQEHYGFLRLWGMVTLGSFVVVIAYLYAAEIPEEKVEHGPVLIFSAYVVGTLPVYYFTNNSLNISKTFGLALFHGHLTDPRAWVYYIGPLTSSFIGVYIYRYFLHNESFNKEVVQPILGVFKGNTQEGV